MLQLYYLPTGNESYLKRGYFSLTATDVEAVMKEGSYTKGAVLRIVLPYSLIRPAS
jgi:hypothetical protein